MAETPVSNSLPASPVPEGTLEECHCGTGLFSVQHEPLHNAAKDAVVGISGKSRGRAPNYGVLIS
jgi:hypothetical protein